MRVSGARATATREIAFYHQTCATGHLHHLARADGLPTAEPLPCWTVESLVTCAAVSYIVPW